MTQFDFLNVWNNPGYVRDSVQDTGFSVRGNEIYTGKTKEGPFVAFRGNSLVGVNEERIGKFGLQIRFMSEVGDVILFIQLYDDEMDDFFAVFAAALAVEIESSDDYVGSVVREHCKKWEVLFHEPEGIQKAVGYIGELYFLSELVNRGITDVSWNGGVQSPQDFLVNGRILVEVKSTSSHSSYNVEIHGIQQLACPPGRELHVIFIRMAVVKDGNYSIESLINSIPREYICREAWKEINDLPERLRRMEFDFIEGKDYPVNDDFPVITRNTLAGYPNAESLVDVDYRINLQNLNGGALDDFFIAAE